MPTQEQIDHWFGFHPPTEVTKPIFDALDAAAEVCRLSVQDATFPSAEVPKAARFAAVAVSVQTFAQAINKAAPESADKTAAIRCLRLARMAANRAINAKGAAGDRVALRALDEIDGAHWNASAAVACGGK
jgi:hypothetical protein